MLDGCSRVVESGSGVISISSGDSDVFDGSDRGVGSEVAVDDGRASSPLGLLKYIWKLFAKISC